MAELVISVPGAENGSRKIRGFRRALPRNLRAGFTSAGSVFQRDMMQKVSGPSHVRHPGVNNPFPGVNTGRLRASVGAEVSNLAGGMQLRVGPNVKYAPFLELGTRKMQPYPFVRPTFEAKVDEAIDTIQETIARPLDR